MEKLKKIEEINRLLKIQKITGNKLLADSGDTIKIGQIWSVKNMNKEINTYLFFVIDVIDNNLVTVLPIFLWTELMGPEDIILPKEFTGVFCAISFELEATVSATEFDKCTGRLEGDELGYIKDAYKSFLNESCDQFYSWGNEYLDEFDHRLKYHEEILSDIEKMQSTAADLILNEENELNILEFKVSGNDEADYKQKSYTLIKFPEFFDDENKIAAVSSGKLHMETINTSIGVELKLLERENLKCMLYVLHENDTSTKIDNYRLVDSKGNCLGIIKDGFLEFDFYKLKHGISIIDQENKELLFIQ